MILILILTYKNFVNSGPAVHSRTNVFFILLVFFLYNYTLSSLPLVPYDLCCVGTSEIQKKTDPHEYECSSLAQQTSSRGNSQYHEVFPHHGFLLLHVLLSKKWPSFRRKHFCLKFITCSKGNKRQPY